MDTDDQFIEGEEAQRYSKVPIGEMPDIKDPITSYQVLRPSNTIILGYGPESEIERVHIFSEENGLFVQSRNSSQVLKPWYSKVAIQDVAAFFINGKGTEETYLYVDVDCHASGVVEKGLGRILGEHVKTAGEVVGITRRRIEGYHSQ